MIDSIQKAIREEKLDGWLFCNFHHRDGLTDSILNLDSGTVSSRRWFFFIPASGLPVKIVHVIEKSILDTLPGINRVYSTKDELVSCLVQFSGKKAAILSDPDIQVLSTLDASSYRLLCECGLKTASAAALVQRIKGLLDPEGIISHEKAASALYRIVGDSWNLVKAAFCSKVPIHEGDIQDFMMREFEKENLYTDHPPIVATGVNSGNPHYSVPGTIYSPGSRGDRLRPGDVVQFDLWAKEPEGIYADISWIGYCGTEIPPETDYRFKTVTAARDLVKPAIEEAFLHNNTITGASLDALVRSFLLSRFPKTSVQHRTGHGIDSDCHGSGANLDSVEFPDTRTLLEGSCFSVEPGIYFPDSGFRTEIDIYISGGKPVISGGEIQTSLLTL